MPPGEFLILVGPSGCGKSTLLNIIAGLEDPTEGQVLIDGRDVVGVPPSQRDIAMVFQSYALYPTMSVADNIGFALEMRAEIKRLHEERGTTTVYVTHDQIEAMTLGSRIAVIKGGILQQLGTPDDVYIRPANVYVATFIGSPTMNMVSGRAASAQGPLVIEGGELPMACPAPGRELMLGFRPEHVSLDDKASWRGEVILVEPTGADTFVVVKTRAGIITVRTEPQIPLKSGDQVGLQVHADHAHWFDAKTELRLRSPGQPAAA